MRIRGRRTWERPRQRKLLGQKKYADAEPLPRAGYEGMKQREKMIPPPGQFRLPEALDRLIELSTATNKPEEVKKWQAERAKYPEVTPISPTQKSQEPCGRFKNNGKSRGRGI